MATVTARKESTSKRKGLGPLPHKKGVAFRVWAPHARRVAVAGTFNGWSTTAHQLEDEGNGYWYKDVPAAAVGDEYRYVLRHGDQELWRIDPYARELTHSNGNAIVHDPRFDWTGDSFHTPPLNELIIYELHVGTFDRTRASRPGTFFDVMEHLEYLQSLGVNAIELMPVTTSVAEDSWRFHPTHLFAVEGSYGGPLGLKKLIKHAHEIGLCVLLDVVYSHVGPHNASLWRFDGWHENDGGGIYFYNDWRADTPWGRTRLDFERPEVRRLLHDNALMWVEEYHCDGLRIDGTRYIRSVDGELRPETGLAEGWELLTWINKDLSNVHPGHICVAEDLHNDAWITKSARWGGAGFTAQWESDFMHRLRDSVQAVQDEHRSMESLRQALEMRFDGDAFKRVIYTECRGTVASPAARLPTGIHPEDPESWWSRKRSTLAAALLLTAPGVPHLLQGQEFLQTGWLVEATPLEWERSVRFAGITQLYRDLIHLRLNREGFTRGLCGQGVELLQVDDVLKLIAFRRWDREGAKDDVIVVANFAHEPRIEYKLPLPADGVWKLRLNTDAKDYCNDFSDIGSGNLQVRAESWAGRPCYGLLSIGPYSLQIYSHEAP